LCSGFDRIVLMASSRDKLHKGLALAFIRNVWLSATMALFQEKFNPAERKGRRHTYFKSLLAKTSERSAQVPSSSHCALLRRGDILMMCCWHQEALAVLRKVTAENGRWPPCLLPLSFLSHSEKGFCRPGR